MYSKPGTDLDFETGHILFIDIVGLSRMRALEQQESLHKLSQIIRNTDAGKSGDGEEELPRLSTGSGLALAFATQGDAAVRCAIQTSKGSRDYPELKLRMGIHSGPVNRISDANDQLGVAGPGVNMARRVTDCADTGHILLSKYAADHLMERSHWQPFLHDLGECEVTAGEIVSAVNFYTEEAGNPALPKKFKRKDSRRPWPKRNIRLGPLSSQNTLLTLLFFSAVAVALSYWLFFPPNNSNSAKDSSGPEVQILTGEKKDRAKPTPPRRAALLHP